MVKLSAQDGKRLQASITSHPSAAVRLVEVECVIFRNADQEDVVGKVKAFTPIALPENTVAGLRPTTRSAHFSGQTWRNTDRV